MLQKSDVFSTYSIKNKEQTKSFYSDTLGLAVQENHMGLIEFDINGHSVKMYQKQDHQPAAFTVLNFLVDDLDSEADDLIAKGVKMEKYDGFDQDEKGISRGRGPNIAWFKDPSGNIISIIEKNS
ncbi:MAG: VOC family protein [Cyclobacteriaceae bacterium]